MRRFALILMLCTPTVVLADWVPLTGEQIAVALIGRTLQYENATQDFRASGKTLYVFGGRDSWGNWAVRGNQYCSQWPPQDLWACYGIEQQGDAVRFVGQGDDITDGFYVD